MPYLGTSPVSFPSYERSRNYFETGVGGPPTANYPDLPQLSGLEGGSSRQITRAGTGASAGGGVASPAAPPAAPPPAAPPPAAPQIESPAPFTGEGYQAPTLGYGTDVQGPLQQRLFQPVQQAAQQGQTDVGQFADLFRQQAGPSRTYQGIGGQGTLATAVEGGAMEPARSLVQAQYAGPAGLDEKAVGGLQFLQGQLEQRQQNLGTGAGLASSIGQTVQTLTPGEARFDAQNIFTPAYRAALQTQVGQPVGAFTEQLGAETAGAQQFAQQRTGEEADIARLAAEYLTGRRGGISEDIQGKIEAGRTQQQEAGQQFSDILGAEDPAATIAAMRAAQGNLDFDPGAFETEAYQAGQGADAAREAIPNDPRFAALKDVPLGELGVDKKGRKTYTTGEDGKDFRKDLSKEDAGLFKERQAALEEAFSSQRGVGFASGQKTSGERFGTPTGQQITDPLYFGDKFQGPEVKSYLNFDPGFKPSRGNVSTEEQRGQFNRINDLLGDLDRIAEDENVYKAATIGASIKQYLEDEATALEKQVDTLDQQGKEWFNNVKNLRKRYRKAEREEKWASIAGSIGTVVGAAAGGPLGGALGALGGIQGGKTLAKLTD